MVEEPTGRLSPPKRRGELEARLAALQSENAELRAQAAYWEDRENKAIIRAEDLSRQLAEANERWEYFQKLASEHRDELERQLAERDAALRSIAEGNLGDDPWQANYAKIREVAHAALSGPGDGCRDMASALPELPRYDANAWPHGFHNLWTEDSMRKFARETASYWRRDAINKAAYIADQYGQTDVANDIRAMLAAAPAPAGAE